jgi:hypothetical protein
MKNKIRIHCLNAQSESWKVFDNVSHEKLVHILWDTDFSSWVIHAVQCFLMKHNTKIVFSDYKSEWMITKTEISQKFSLFNSLSLLHIWTTDSLWVLRKWYNDVWLCEWHKSDDIKESVQNNCRQLKTAHSHCIVWAKRHEARFVSDKYQLIHFTKCRYDFSDNLMSTVQFENQEILNKTTIQILSVQMNARLNWREYVHQTTQKSITAFEALLHIIAVTWSSSIKHFRLLYTAIVQSVMLYESQMWSLQQDNVFFTVTLIKSLKYL